MKKIIYLLASLVLCVSCAKDQESSSLDTETTSAEDAVTSISSLLDDQSNESYAYQKRAIDQLNNILFPKAYASACQRPVLQTCNAGEKSSSFTDCTSLGGRFNLSGEILLSYSQNDCSMALDGDFVTRTYDYTFSGPRGGTLQVTSEVRENYLGESIGGGGLLTKVSGGYEIDIMGKHKIFTRNGTVLRDHSVRTLQPLQVTGGLSRSLRRVSQGQIEISHNLAQFKAVYTANNLQWSNSCCHPVSGSISVEYSGAKSGTGQIEFNGCNDAQLTVNGEAQSVEFSYCE